MESLDTWLDHISSQHWQSVDMGLERMQVMVERLALQRPANRVITVAGTNGKGSTCVACEAFLLHQGLRVGVTLSPHISRFNERMRIDGQELDDRTICNSFAAVEDARQDLPLTYFEFSALAALHCFKHAQVDVAVLEIGLGGRLDAFNAIDADVAVITSIGLDHEAFLGDTRDLIGYEKAGILRPGQQVVLGRGMPDTVLERCRALELNPEIVGTDVDCSVESDGTWHLMRGGEVIVQGIPANQCAPDNLLLGYLAVAQMWHLPPSVVRSTAPRVALRGRFEKVSRRGRSWLLDVAHNPASAAFLCAQLQARGLHPRMIVCAMLRDKDHRGVYDALAASFDAPWRILDSSGARGMSATELAAQLPASRSTVATSWSEVLAEVSSATLPGDVILVFGSFNVIEQFELIDHPQISADTRPP